MKENECTYYTAFVHDFLYYPTVFANYFADEDTRYFYWFLAVFQHGSRLFHSFVSLKQKLIRIRNGTKNNRQTKFNRNFAFRLIYRLKKISSDNQVSTINEKFKFVPLRIFWTCTNSLPILCWWYHRLSGPVGYSLHERR